MTEPDEALLWAREQSALPAVQTVTAHAYRAGAAASAERIKALEARVAELERRWGGAAGGNWPSGVYFENGRAVFGGRGGGGQG